MIFNYLKKTILFFLIIFLAVNINAGVVIGPSIEISDAGGYSNYPSLVYNSYSSMFAVAWLDGRSDNDNYEIYYSRITPEGGIDKSERSVDPNAYDESFPALSPIKDSSEYAVVWNTYSSFWGYSLSYKHFDKYADEIDKMTLKTLSDTEQRPAMVRRGSYYGIVVSDYNSQDHENDIYFYEVKEDGTIENFINITYSLSGDSVSPSIATSGSKYAITFTNDSRDLKEIYAAIVDDNGDLDYLESCA